MLLGVADMDQDGRIDVLATTAAGEPVYGRIQGKLVTNGWMFILNRPR